MELSDFHNHKHIKCDSFGSLDLKEYIIFNMVVNIIEHNITTHYVEASFVRAIQC